MSREGTDQNSNPPNLLEVELETQTDSQITDFKQHDRDRPVTRGN